jgi:hypothetical protein
LQGEACVLLRSHHELVYNFERAVLTFPLRVHSHAVAVSELVPFLEYDLHKQLLYKLRLLGMNAVFGMKTQLCIGDGIVVAMIQGTAVCLPALPRPQPLKITSKTSDMVHLHSRLNQISVQNVRYRFRFVLSVATFC